MVVADTREVHDYCRNIIEKITEEHNKTYNKSLYIHVYFSNRLTRKYGYCKSYKNSDSCEVYLSDIFIKDCWSKGLKEAIKEVVIHEVAHAIVKDLYGFGHGHDKYFREVVIRLGGKNTTRTAVLSPTYKPYRYIYRCPNCNKVIRSKRKRVGACAKCCDEFNNGEYTDKYTWVLVEDKGRVDNWG